jgi:hypothetical protein
MNDDEDVGQLAVRAILALADDDIVRFGMVVIETEDRFGTVVGLLERVTRLTAMFAEQAHGDVWRSELTTASRRFEPRAD